MLGFLPAFDGLHPLVVHFPLVLLLVAPLFIALALFRKDVTGPYAVSAWILLALGTAAAWAATLTGEGASTLVVATDEITRALERHSDLGEYTRDVATVVTLIFSALLGWVLLLRKPLAPPWPFRVMVLVFIGSLAAALLVGMTGHAGSYLVHGLKVTNPASFLPPMP